MGDFTPLGSILVPTLCFILNDITVKIGSKTNILTYADDIKSGVK